MSTRFLQPGHRREFTAGETIVSGFPIALRTGATGEIGVAESDVTNGAVGVCQVSGVHRLPKAAGAIAAHALVYLNTTSDDISTTASGNTLAGTAVAAATTAATTVDVLINNRPGAALSD